MKEIFMLHVLACNDTRMQVSLAAMDPHRAAANA